MVCFGFFFIYLFLYYYYYYFLGAMLILILGIKEKNNDKIMIYWLIHTVLKCNTYKDI